MDCSYMYWKCESSVWWYGVNIYMYRYMYVCLYFVPFYLPVFFASIPTRCFSPDCTAHSTLIHCWSECLCFSKMVCGKCVNVNFQHQIFHTQKHTLWIWLVVVLLFCRRLHRRCRWCRRRRRHCRHRCRRHSPIYLSPNGGKCGISFMLI